MRQFMPRSQMGAKSQGREQHIGGGGDQKTQPHGQQAGGLLGQQNGCGKAQERTAREQVTERLRAQSFLSARRCHEGQDLAPQGIVGGVEVADDGGVVVLAQP